MHIDWIALPLPQSIPLILELRSKCNSCEFLFLKAMHPELRGTNRTICASNIESRKSNISSPLTDFLRIVRSSRGWLTTGPKFKLHPRTESLLRAEARPRHHAGANFSQVLQCHADGKLGCASARISGTASHFQMLEKARGEILIASRFVALCASVSLLYISANLKLIKADRSFGNEQKRYSKELKSVWF